MKPGPVKLIVEDDLIIADYLEETLQDAGFEVCGIARTISEAIALARRHHPSLGVIDLKLSNGEQGTQVAAALCEESAIGILYATGNSRHPLLDDAVGDACISKPYTSERIVAGVRIVAERMAKRALPPVFPEGFRLLNVGGCGA